MLIAESYFLAAWESIELLPTGPVYYWSAFCVLIGDFALPLAIPATLLLAEAWVILATGNTILLFY